MKTDDVAEYYADLLIIEYRSKPKARAHVKAVATAALLDQLPSLIQAAYDIDTAVGAQLDVLGKYRNVTRLQRDFSGLVNLDDTDYRQLIKLKIVQDFSGSSLADIQTLLDQFFSGVLQVYDHKNMTMGYYFDATFGSQQLAEIFVRGGFLPVPMGVQLNALIYAVDALTTGFFGFRTYDNAYASPIGFNDYAESKAVGPWLTYENAITLP